MEEIYWCNATYDLMRDVSDQLCQEYQLSVIEETKSGKAMLLQLSGKRSQENRYLAGAHHQDIDGVIQEERDPAPVLFPDAAEGLYFQTKREVFYLKTARQGALCPH